MPKIGKRKKAGDALLEKGRKVHRRGGVSPSSRRRPSRQVRRDRRPRRPPRRQSQARRSDGARRHRAAARHGQTLRVLVFAKGEKEKEARGAGADFAGADELVQKVSEGFMDFDRVIATPDMMGAVGKLGRILGPRGLMPNPKVGTVTFDVKQRRAAKPRPARSSTASRRRASCTRASAKSSFAEQALADNAMALIQALVRAEAVDGQGHLPAEHHAHLDHGPGRSHRPGQRRVDDRGGRLMDRATKATLDRRDQGPLRQDDLGCLPRLQGDDRRGSDQAPRRVPQERRRVQGRQEHARQASAQDKPWAKQLDATLAGMTGVAWSYEEPRRPRRSSRRSARTTRSSRSRRGSSTAQVLDGKGVETSSRRCPARTSFAPCCSRRMQAPLQQLRRSCCNAPAQNFVYLLAAKEREGQSEKLNRATVNSRQIQISVLEGFSRRRDNGESTMADITQ